MAAGFCNQRRRVAPLSGWNCESRLVPACVRRLSEPAERRLAAARRIEVSEFQGPPSTTYIFSLKPLTFRLAHYSKYCIMRSPGTNIYACTKLRSAHAGRDSLGGRREGSFERIPKRRETEPRLLFTQTTER